MAENVRATIYFNPKIYRALRIKAAESGQTVSGLVSRAVAESLAEDRIDLAAFEKRKREARRPLADVLRDLKRDGLLLGHCQPFRGTGTPASPQAGSAPDCRQDGGARSGSNAAGLHQAGR